MANGKPIGNMKVILDLDSSAFSKGLEGAKKSVAYNTKAMKAQMQVMNYSGDKVGALQAKYDGLSKTLSSNEKYMSKLKTQYDKSFDANGKATASTAKYANELNQAIAKSASYEAQMKTTTGQIARMKVETEGITGKLKTQSEQWVKSGKKIESFGKKMSSIGSTLTMSVTAPIAAGFGLATKKAVDFQTQIGEIGPLLTNGGKMTTEYRNQLDQMSDSSKKWAKEYGVSTTEINTGLAEIVRKGYDANQTLGVMPSILDATKASGDDFNDVMNVTTEVISQFNLKGKDYNSTVKNATRVTDALTYVANATSAGFSDLGLAMGYVGPVANSLGMDVEETASAIGLLSDAGIGGEKAGTALRGALTRLLKPSKQNIAGFEKLGISVDEFKNGTLTLPDMLNKIKQNTEGWTDAQRTSAIALAFGTESQSAMNVLVGQGGDALKGLTKETYNANGATKEIAKSMNDLPANKVARFKESLNVLAITAGEKLLPVFTPILEKATQLINKFSELDDETQQNILKWGLMAAAAGPTLKLLGGGISIIGKTKTAVGKLSGGLVELAAKAAEKRAIAGFSTTVASVGTASATAAGTSGVAGLGASIAGLAGPIGIGLVALGAVAGAVVVGKKAYDDYQLSGGKWGTEVTGTQDKVITKSNELKEKGVQYMNEYQDGVNTNAEKIKKANKGIQDAIEGTLEKEEKRREKITKLSFLDEETKAWYEQVIAAQKKVDEKTAETVKTQIDKINGIYKNASDNNRQLSDQEMQYIRSSYANLSDDQLKAAGFTKSQRLAIETAYQDDLSKLSEKEVSTRIKTLEKSLDKEKTSYDKQRKEIESNETLSSSVRKRLLNDLKENYKKSTSEMITALGNLTEKSGSSLDSVWFKWEKYGYNVEEVTALVSSSVKDTTKDLSLFAKGTSDADMQWNALSLDPKTGEVKTNMTDVLTEIAQTDDGWNQLKFMVKEAKLTSNAKEEVAIAMGEAGKWDQLWLTEKMLLVNGDEAKLELYETINAMGAWNQYVLDRKALGIDNADAVYKLFTTQEQINQWNTLPVNQKKLLADNTDLTEKIFASNESYTAWTQVPDNIKNMLADNADLKSKIQDGTISMEQYNQVLPLLKQMFGDNYDLLNKSDQSKTSIKDLNEKYIPKDKYMKGNNSDVLEKSTQVKASITDLNEKYIPKDMHMNGVDNVSKPASEAVKSYREVANLQDKTISFKLTAFFDDTWEKVKKAFNQKGNNLTGKYAKGTNYHLGGPAIVNDQRGSLYKELVIPKGGTPFIPQGRNVLLPDLTKGSKVLNASKTKQLIPRYAGGIGEVITSDSEITELIRAINELIMTFKTMQPQSAESDTVGMMTEKSVIPNTQGTAGIASITPDQLLAQGEEYTAIGTMWMTNLMNGWNSIVPQYMASETLFISDYLTQLSNQNNPNYLQGVTWNRNLMNGWNSLTGTFINLIKTFCNQAMTTLRSYNAPMYNNGRAWQQNNLNGWNSLYGSFIARVNQLGNDSINNLRSKNGGFYSAGSYLMQSLINGLNSMGGSLSATMNGVANKMVGGIGKGVNGVIGGVNHVMTQVEGKSLKPWTPPQYAKGTDGHPGGLAMINDQKGSIHEEYVQMPDGRGFIAKGKDLLVNLPKGAQVLNASLTKKLKNRLDIPHYANGTDDFDIFDLIDDEEAFKKLVDKKIDYNSILEPWKNMTKAGVKLMTSSAYPFVQKEIEENFSTGEFDGSIFQGEGNFNGVYAYLVEVAKKVMAKFPGLIPTSGYRAGDVYHHGKHQAIDISGYPVGSPRYTAAANYAFEKFPRDVGYVITNGRVRDRIGFSGTGVHDGWATWPAGDHFDHVHISGSKGAGDIYSGGSNSPRKSPKPTGSHENWMRLAGFKPSEYSAINYIVNHESSWNPSATNPSSGAYGLPQSLPASKLASAGSDWRTNPITQLRWMRDYVNGRYGGANGALAFWKRNHWYANGGLINKDGLYRAGEGNKPEMVIPLTRKTRAIELMGQALAFMAGDNKQSKDNSSNRNTDVSKLENKLDSMIELLQALLIKDSNIYLDGTLVEKKVSRIRNRNERLDNRRAGFVV